MGHQDRSSGSSSDVPAICFIVIGTLLILTPFILTFLSSLRTPPAKQPAYLVGLRFEAARRACIQKEIDRGR